MQSWNPPALKSWDSWRIKTPGVPWWSSEWKTDHILYWYITLITVWILHQKSREKCAKSMILLLIFIICNQSRRQMTQYMKKMRRKMIGTKHLGLRKIAITIIKIRITRILSRPGMDINSWEVLEETTKLDKEHQGSLTKSSMAMNPMPKGQHQIPRQRKSHQSTRTILTSTGQSKLLWLSNQIWTWWSVVPTSTRLLPPLLQRELTKPLLPQRTAVS